MLQHLLKTLLGCIAISEQKSERRLNSQEVDDILTDYHITYTYIWRTEGAFIIRYWEFCGVLKPKRNMYDSFAANLANTIASTSCRSNELQKKRMLQYLEKWYSDVWNSRVKNLEEA